MTQQGNSLATNSIALCFRMIIRMAISLYTIRVILNALGVEDYGIYNVIAGFNVMFSFVNTSMSTAISRFLAFEIGRNESELDLKDIFKTAFTTQAILALVIVILAELIGVPIINHYLAIPRDRLHAANILYQCTLVSLVINIIQVPYNASIIAFEKMTAYAYIEIVYVSALLLIALALNILSGPLLIYYGGMLVLVNLLILLCYYLYTRRFQICTSSFLFRWSLIKPMVVFSGADFYSNCSLSLQTQGQNVIINKFYGLVANASIGIASNIYGAMLMFSSSITTAIKPRIIKLYASREYSSFRNLIIDGSRLISFFNSVVCIPAFFSVPWILELWLEEVPKYAVVFTQILLVNHCLYSYKPILIGGLHATGKITGLSIVSGTWYILSIGIQFLLAYHGAKIETVFGFIIILTGLNIIIITFYLGREADLRGWNILKNVIAPLTFVFLGMILIGLLAQYLMPSEGIYEFIRVIGVSLINLPISSVFILDNRTRQYLIRFLSTSIGKLKSSR